MRGTRADELQHVCRHFGYDIQLVAALSRNPPTLATWERESGRLDAQGYGYTAFDYFESAGFVGLKLYAAIMLFRLRRIAVKLFLATLFLNFVATGYDLVSKGLPPPGGPVILFSLITGFGMLVLICLYAWRLERRHVLT